MKSETDPLLLDKIGSVSSDSEIEANFYQALSSSPIQWSPRTSTVDVDPQTLDQALLQIDDTVPSTPPVPTDLNRAQNLEAALDYAQAQAPHLQPVEQGRVYDMAPILESYHEQEQRRRTTRDVKRHDYKKTT